MNKIITTLLSSAALAASAFAGTTSSGKGGAAPVAPAPANDDIGGTLTVGYDTDFYFRGIALGEDWVTAGLNYGIGFTDTLSLNVGAIYGNDFGQFDFDRTVLSAGLTQDFGVVDLTAGYRYYSFDGADTFFFDDTSEVFLNLNAALGPVNVGLASNYDITDESWYFELGVNSEIKLTDRISLVPGANIGYGVDYNYQTGTLINFINQLFGADGAIADGFTAVTLSLAAPIKLTSRATLTPYIAGRLPVDALDDLGEDNEVYGGVSLSLKF
jgi:hypothetical protein